MHPVLPSLGCLRLLRWTDQGDHLRTLIRLLMVSVLTPPHQSPFRIKASGAAPERRSSPCPWRPAPQQIIGTLPCPCGLQVMRSHAWHCLPRSRLPEGASSHGLHHPDLVTADRAPRLGCRACTRSRQRRWRQTRRSNAANGGPPGSVANQHSWLPTNAVDELTPPAV